MLVCSQAQVENYEGDKNMEKRLHEYPCCMSLRFLWEYKSGREVQIAYLCLLYGVH